MKIVKRGKKPDEVFEGVCDECKSVLEARRDELKIDGAHDYRTDFKEFGVAPCIACRHKRVVFYIKPQLPLRNDADSK